MVEKYDWETMLDKEGPIPVEVRACAERLQSSGVWWQSSINHEKKEVFTCKHAVKFRQRLGSGGNGGVPLWSELKSVVGIAIDPVMGKKIGFVAHTRANTEINDPLVLDCLGLNVPHAEINWPIHDEDTSSESPNKLQFFKTPEDTTGERNKWFGIVNPFNVHHVLSDIMNEDLSLEEIPQILDESLLLEGGIPNTIMSNLGNRTIAFEVHPEGLISTVKQLSPKSFITKIAKPCPIWLGLKGKHLKDYWLQFPPAQGPKVGILTGNSPESGITLWQDMLDTLRKLFPHLPDTLMPEVHVHSVPAMGLSMELVSREEEVWEVVKQGVEGLLARGCRIVTLACNTTIYYEPQIAKLCDAGSARFVSIAEACMPAVQGALERSTGLERVGLVGIGPVVDMNGSFSGYKRHLEAGGIQVIPCPADRLAFAVKSKGTGEELVTKFQRLVRDTLGGITVVILALTEVSMVYRKHQVRAPKKQGSKIEFIDPLKELGKYLAFLYLCQGYKECLVCQIPTDYPVDEKLKPKFGWKQTLSKELIM